MVIFTTNYFLMRWHNMAGMIETGGLMAIDLPYELVTTGQLKDGITQVRIA